MLKTAKEAYEYAYNNGVKFPTNWYITKNFKWNEAFVNELSSDGIPIFEVFENVVHMAYYMQQFRDKIGKPINVHCWVRQIPHNKRAGSTAKYSSHINGLAVDFDVTGLNSNEVRAFALACKLDVRIEKDTQGWVHFDRTRYATYRPGLFS